MVKCYEEKTNKESRQGWGDLPRIEGDTRAGTWSKWENKPGRYLGKKILDQKKKKVCVNVLKWEHACDACREIWQKVCIYEYL